MLGQRLGRMGTACVCALGDAVSVSTKIQCNAGERQSGVVGETGIHM